VSPWRIILAGLAGGAATNVAMLVMFRFLGFGSGLLLDPRWQSLKLIAVWTQIEPLPRVVGAPLPIILGLFAFSLFHTWLYAKLSASWPHGLWPRAWRLGGLVFILSYVFFEFFTPFNLFWEPLLLVAVELAFWAVVALVEALAIVAVLERPRT
jgi:hypothetical protein